MKAYNEILKNTKVILRKGTIVHSTHPQKSEYTLSRRQTVTVHRYAKEYTNHYSRSVPYLHAAEITWVGTGSYWCWAKVDDIEEICN